MYQQQQPYMQMQPPAMPAPGMYYGRGYPPQQAYGVPPMQGESSAAGDDFSRGDSS
jgi:hypothetical protein